MKVKTCLSPQLHPSARRRCRELEGGHSPGQARDTPWQLKVPQGTKVQLLPWSSCQKAPANSSMWDRNTVL